MTRWKTSIVLSCPDGEHYERVFSHDFEAETFKMARLITKKIAEEWAHPCEWHPFSKQKPGMWMRGSTHEITMSQYQYQFLEKV